MEELSAVSSRDPLRPPRTRGRSEEANPAENNARSPDVDTSNSGTPASTADQISRLRQSMQQHVNRQDTSTPPSQSPAPETYSPHPDTATHQPATPRRGTPGARSESPPSSLRERSASQPEPFGGQAGHPDEQEYVLRQRPAPTRQPNEDDFDTYRYDDEFDDETFDEEPRRQRPERRSLPTVRIPNVRMSRPTLPPAVAQADLVNDQASLGIIGLNVFSLGLMAVFVANRIDTLPEVIATHVSASGLLGNFTTRSAVWQIPLLAGMLSLMNVAAAWFIASVDMFAGRFLLAASILVQLIAWVALFRILW